MAARAARTSWLFLHCLPAALGSSPTCGLDEACPVARAPPEASTAGELVLLQLDVEPRRPQGPASELALSWLVEAINAASAKETRKTILAAGALEAAAGGEGSKRGAGGRQRLALGTVARRGTAAAAKLAARGGAPVWPLVGPLVPLAQSSGPGWPYGEAGKFTVTSFAAGIDGDGNGVLSPEEKLAFFDANGDGVISPEEVTSEIFKSMDANKNNRLESNEFPAALDTDLDGVVNDVELNTLVEGIGMSLAVTPARVTTTTAAPSSG